MSDENHDEVTPDDGVTEGGGVAEEGLNPEKDSPGAYSLQEASLKTLEANFTEIISCILGNIKNKHLPSAKLLVDLAMLGQIQHVPAARYESLADVVWAAFRKIEELEQERKTIEGQKQVLHYVQDDKEEQGQCRR